MGLADETICLAVDIAAAVKLNANDRIQAEDAALKAAAAMWGVKQEDEIVWDTEVELD